MMTSQVQNLSADLSEIIRRHVDRDLTRTEIVRQLATEACALIEDDQALDHLRLMLGSAVEMAVDHPQTVNAETRRDSPWAARVKAHDRLGRHLVVAVVHARQGGLEPETLVSELLHQVIGVLAQPDRDAEPTSEILPRYRRAFDLVREARDALRPAFVAGVRKTRKASRINTQQPL
jgi:hypothetical protein